MKSCRFLVLFSLSASFCCAAEGEVKWLHFSKAFIESLYGGDSAIADLVVKPNGAQPASKVHPRSCSGDDGELHVGIRNDDLVLPGGARPPSLPETEDDPDWGIVSELPNAALGDGPSTLADLLSKQITFHGYLRVWNEGHDQGNAPPSNPHHVFEIHPAWKFTATGGEFDEPGLVK
jgi:hypothetical protein